MTADDAVAQTASQCFDISVWQFLAALLRGARVHIIPDDVAHDPTALLHHVDETGITIVESVRRCCKGSLPSMAACRGRFGGCYRRARPCLRPLSSVVLATRLFR